MTRRRLAWSGVAAFIALALIVSSLVSLTQARAGLSITRMTVGNTPVRVFQDDRLAESDATPPRVLIAHGFAGSQQLMEPFALSLARQGYLAVTFDFLGHGQHPRPLGGDVTKVEGSTQQLLSQMGTLAAFARTLPPAANGRGDAKVRLGLLGHSMASDVVVRYAQQDPAVDATVAVSMFSPAVTAASPGNLLIIDGEWESFLVQEGERVMGLVSDPQVPEAGVTYGSLRAGDARRLEVAPGVEHVSVLYSAYAHRAAADWFRERWAAPQADAGDADESVAPRGGAIVRLFLGMVLLTWPLAALLPRVVGPSPSVEPVNPAPQGGWRGAAPSVWIPAIATPLLLFWVPANFLGVLVGGYLVVHFAVYGLITWACMHRWPPAPKRALGELLPGRAAIAIVATILWTTGAFAWALDSWFTAFIPTAPRVPLLAAMVIATASYFFADEWLCGHYAVPRGMRLVTRLSFLLSLAIAVALSLNELFFLIIIAALVAFYFLVYGLMNAWINRATGHPLVAAMSSAMAFAWALAVVFPMMTGQ
ncbi:MAG: alpha/beta fold hydrolase [Pseudomonadota bacterium]